MRASQRLAKELKHNIFRRNFITAITTIAVLFLVAAFIGSVFVFLVPCHNASVSIEDCPTVFTEISRCKGSFGGRGGNLQQIILDCCDGQRYFIEECNSELLTQLQELESGAAVTLLLHPNGGNIMELRHGDTILLEFDTVMRAKQINTIGFLIIGLLLYAFCIWLVFCGVQRVTRYKKERLA